MASDGYDPVSGIDGLSCLSLGCVVVAKKGSRLLLAISRVVAPVAPVAPRTLLLTTTPCMCLSHPLQRRSKVSEGAMETWRSSPVTGDLLEVPGIGPAAVKKLAECPDRITNSYQLFGKYLMLKGPDVKGHKVQSMEHNEKFWYFLKNTGIAAHRSAIVKAIAEKSATFFRDIVSAKTCEGLSVVDLQGRVCVGCSNVGSSDLFVVALLLRFSTTRKLC